LKVAWQQTEQSQATIQNPFGASASQIEAQATERLCKGAPPGTPMIILVSDFDPQTSPIKL